jgi:hypothetical protein
MNPLFAFGERLDGYAVPVLNERAVRAGAGILFLLAMVAFMNAWLLGNFQPTRVFVVAFLIDFTIRIFVNPRYAPSLVLGHWVVRKQQPEWTGAPQKRFAWAIGFVLAAVMWWLVVVQRVVGPVNILVCATCITLLFFETAFGICLGCKVYNLFHRDAAQLCPGGVCEVGPDPRVQPGWAQGLVLLGYVGVLVLVAPAADEGGKVARASQDVVLAQAAPATPRADTALATAPAAKTSAAQATDAARCKVPAFAKALGHEQMWKLHNNCP